MSISHPLASQPLLASGERTGKRHAARCILFALAAASCWAALVQAAGPTDNKGVTTSVLGSIDLSTEIPEATGRQLAHI